MNETQQGPIGEIDPQNDPTPRLPHHHCEITTKAKGPKKPSTRGAPLTRLKRRYGKFELRHNGVFIERKTGDEPEAKSSWLKCCDPLTVEGLVRGLDSGGWGFLLCWADPDGKKHEWICPAELLHDANKLIPELTRRGLRILPGHKTQIPFYIAEVQEKENLRRVRAVDAVGWQESLDTNGQVWRVFVLPDEVIGKTVLPETFVLRSKPEDHRFRCSGTLEEWQENVARHVAGNPLLVFTVSAAFAGPLLEPTGSDSAGFHLHQNSSVGKTTALVIAGSVWGGGGSGRGFVNTWRTTDNALESTAVLHNHCLLCLDEISELDPNKCSNVTYMLVNGQEKGRRHGDLTDAKRRIWKGMYLSTGELSFGEHAEQAQKRIKAGAEVRMLSIDADAGAGFGVFADLHGLPTPGDFADLLKRNALKYYGTPIRAFLRHLAANWDTAISTAAQTIKRFTEANLPLDAGGEVVRACDKFALVAAAGELSTHAGVTDWRAGGAFEAAGQCFQKWLAARGTHGSSDVQKGIEQIRDYLQTFGRTRFEEIGCPDFRGNQRDGYYKPSKDGCSEFMLTEDSLKKICRGFRYKAVVRAIADQGHLLIEDDHLKVKRTINKRQQRLYVIKESFLAADDSVPEHEQQSLFAVDQKAA